jgi:hypothetical protein
MNIGLFVDPGRFAWAKLPGLGFPGFTRGPCRPNEVRMTMQNSNNCRHSAEKPIGNIRMYVSNICVLGGG